MDKLLQTKTEMKLLKSLQLTKRRKKRLQKRLKMDKSLKKRTNKLINDAQLAVNDVKFN